MNSSQDVYEIRPRKDRRGFDLIGDRLPLGLLWFEGPDAFGEAVRYAKFFSRSQPAVIRLFDQSGAVIETHEHAGGFQRVVKRIGCPVLIRWRTTDPRATPLRDEFPTLLSAFTQSGISRRLEAAPTSGSPVTSKTAVYRAGI